ncbi:MAG: tetraacyldisaccharide 4'-kinase [Candidatus Omnitrophota bacterium]
MRKFIYSLLTKANYSHFYVLLAPLLLIFSFVYLGSIEFIKLFFRLGLLKSARPRAKVISVGNITWGGTGKSSLSIFLNNFLRAKGKRPAILIRGYGDDEDRMLKEFANALVLSGKNRVTNAKEAEGRHGADVLILDDGFQHWRLKRDLDIVTVNANNPFGNERLIPAGILREPLSALARADIILITKINLADKENIQYAKDVIAKVAPKAEVFQAQYKAVSIIAPLEDKRFDLSHISGKRLCAVASVGDNDSFFKMLFSLNARVTDKIEYPDHHKYTARDVEIIKARAKDSNSDAIITTTKDWIRLRRHYTPTPDVFLLDVSIRIIDEEKFFNRISSLLAF